MLEHARGILHQVALAKEELSGTKGTLSGPISIGLPPSLSKLITVPLTLAFQKALPQAKLTLTEGFSAPMYESLRSGRIDIALLYNPAPTPELEQTTPQTFPPLETDQSGFDSQGVVRAALDRAESAQRISTSD